MIKIKEFENGLRVVVEEMPAFESASFNICVKTGSNNEKENNRGISHFIEHMIFKGTETRNAQQIAKEFDEAGATINAYTSKAETVYYSKGVAEELESCVALWGDMFTNSIFASEDLEREKKVVLEEMAMCNDDPAITVGQNSDKKLYEHSVYENSIIGTAECIKSFSKQMILEYLENHYSAKNIVISVAGKVLFDDVIDIIEKHFPTLTTKKYEEKEKISHEVLDVQENAQIREYKDNEQTHVSVAFQSINLFNKEVNAHKIMNFILGGSMSSLLFTKIREELGLVYTIYSSFDSRPDFGEFTINFATQDANVGFAVEKISDLIHELEIKGFKEEDFLKAKKSLLAKLKMSYESTMTLGMSNGLDLMFINKTKTKEEKISAFENVTFEDVNAALKQTFANKKCVLSMVGRSIEEDLLTIYLER